MAKQRLRGQLVFFNKILFLYLHFLLLFPDEEFTYTVAGDPAIYVFNVTELDRTELMPELMVCIKTF